MNWLSRLLGFKDIVMPDVENILKDNSKQTRELFLDSKTLKGKDISEPVLAIIKTMQKYPSRFKVRFDESLSKDQPFLIFHVTDIKSGEKVVYSRYYCSGLRHGLSWTWLTEDEEEVLCTEGGKVYENKVERKKSFERARMKGIYNAN